MEKILDFVSKLVEVAYGKWVVCVAWIFLISYSRLKSIANSKYCCFWILLWPVVLCL